MAIIVGNKGNFASTTGSDIFSGTINVNQKWVLFGVAGIDNQNTTAITATATLGGASMGAVRIDATTTTTSRYYYSAFFLMDATSYQGTQTVQVTWSQNINGCVGFMVAVGGLTDNPNGAEASNNDGSVNSVTTTALNSYIFTVVSQRSNTTVPTFTPEAGQTALYEDINSGALTTANVAEFYYYPATTITSYSVGATPSATNGDMGISIELLEAPSELLFLAIDFR